MLEHFNTLHTYLVATLVHWSLCGVCGALTVQSHYKGGPMLRMLATVIVSGWALYEGLEQLRIADRGDVDVANGLFAYVTGALLVSAWHYGKRHWRKHHA